MAGAGDGFARARKVSTVRKEGAAGHTSIEKPVEPVFCKLNLKILK
jgi:hypothetical protein